ncbi:uncharacterized protein TEOVI_000850400 [Trypanosoma equiperdum]|uniref:Uncharacterized protein n=3 Tax=Trypanozoon TaxID=39700 RepID=Q38FF0_TRYB2|nr:hypothetical protein, unlikely [Trypanosoma brucei brucei TREU927]EAN76470.1 hypothetical protein, unlikely [Trypanosoma brucei brucei TREU927]RHW70405.1 hypothetical protein DPX39_090014900 [Trypanosoma brucei equiperdum]SCU68966.1 hypothetical protein, conserved [Trypanosoma equiperdum]
MKGRCFDPEAAGIQQGEYYQLVKFALKLWGANREGAFMLFLQTYPFPSISLLFCILSTACLPVFVRLGTNFTLLLILCDGGLLLRPPGASDEIREV